LVINFSKINLTERPCFILRNLDGTAIGYLKNILNPTGKLCYNEVSEINFEYPSQINGEKLDEYDLLTGMRIIDVQNFGLFLLRNPVETDNGIVKRKECTAYSLEYELTNKNISLEEGTYNFWNPLTPDSTILGIILSEAKSWSVGTVSTNLIGKYRTFSVDNRNIYDWMKSDLQETYGCIFDFDTYNRKINVRSINDIVLQKPVYLSTKNLIKEIEIEENTDDLVTALDVYGADGVTIRSVNPMGTNRIYNLDSYMNSNYFSSQIIERWTQWKSTFESYQQTYYQIVVARNMQISRYTVEEGILADLQGELLGLESKKAVIIQAIAIDEAVESELQAINDEIDAKNTEISKQQEILKQVQDEIDSYSEQLKEINNKTSLSSFFSDDELIILDRYFKCGSLTDSTFVATTTNSYASDTKTVRDISSIFNITEITSITKTPYLDDITFYIIHGGSINFSNADISLNAEVVNGTLQVNNDMSFVLSLYLNQGSVDDTDFSGGTLSMTGTLSTDVISTDTSIQFKTTSSTIYMTQDVTEYQRMSVEQELFEYGYEYLERLSSPTYYFSVSSANFLALNDFIQFANEFELGEKVYIHTSSGVLTPIAVAVSIDFDNLSDFTIDFGNSFSLNDSSFKLEDLLDQSVSMGASLDFNQYNYSNFVNSGAKTQVKNFMTNAIDTMKNRILSGDQEQITIDRAGLRCRKYDENSGTYSPKQIWLAHNALMFTNDNWDSATIGIGEFIDKNLGSMFGIVAPAIVGTILAGSQLVIESEKQDGDVAVFKMDAEGCSLHNASFNLYGNTTGRIDLGATYGIIGGNDKNIMFDYDSNNQPIGVRTENGETVTRISELDLDDAPNANFWIDMYGDVYLKGTIDAVSGVFRGSLEVGGSTAFRVDKQGNLKIGGTDTNPNFSVDANGNLVSKSANIKGRIDASSLYINGKNILTNCDDGSATDSSQIASKYLELYGITIYNASTGGISFSVSDSGAVTINGNVTMGAGSSINWATVQEINPTSSLAYVRANSAYNLADNAFTNAGNAYDRADAAISDAAYALNFAQNNACNDRNIFSVLTSGGSKFGIFSDSDSNRLLLNANYIRSGTIDADIITLGSSWGGFCCAVGNDGINNTYGAMMYGSNSQYYFIATNLGVRMQARNTGITCMATRIAADVPIDVDSDRRAKNNISDDLSKYKKFFMSLKPSYFKYNNGTSGRYHIGFIAQEVEDALLNSGITTKDFAGIVQSQGDNDISREYDNPYFLRYNEFIALNTYMIQHLYKRIDKLEKIVKGE